MRLQRFLRVNQFIIVGLLVLLFLGGLGYERGLVLAIGGVTSVLLLTLTFLRKEKILLPKGFLVYSLFLLFFGASLFWSFDWQKSFAYLMLFASGGMFWVVLFNLKEETGKSIEKAILVLGILFGAFALAYKFLNFAPLGKAAFSLVFPATDNHHHIGDFWAIVLVFVIFKVLVKKKYTYSLFFIPGIYFLIISLSRAAYVTFAAGASLIFYYKGWFQKYRKLLVLFFVLIASLFLFAGVQKTTLFSRPYYFQALVGLVKYPLGVGYGNFGSISGEYQDFFGKLAGFSSVTHNIILEILAGMGILGASFIYWLYIVLRSLLVSVNNKNAVFVAAFFAIFTNFLFDFTYFISSMLWFFFIFLGLASKKKQKFKGDMFVVYLMVAFLILSSLLITFRVLNINFLG